MCLDNLVPLPSTLPLAGRGAFAQRHIPAGSRIVPVPLLQIPYRESLLMYPPEMKQEQQEQASDKYHSSAPSGAQLLLNYCFGHRSISMLLCPATNANLINHCSSRKSYGGQCSELGPNAQIVWASWDPMTKDWLNKSIPEINTLTEQSQRGLSLDIVALRDINPGDEVRRSFSFFTCFSDTDDEFSTHHSNSFQ
jgi:hypothetical protein